MKQIFVDTAAFIALGNKQDNWHQQTVTISRQLTLAGYYFVTTEAVLLETCNAFSRACYKPLALKFVETARYSVRWQCISVDTALFENSLSLFQKMSDKDWSLVDCMSMTVANTHRINLIFTSDYHFEQAGFTILLKKKQISAFCRIWYIT
jgi:predicted nucleic acid-binding protein